MKTKKGKWGKNYRKPTKSFAFNRAIEALRETLFTSIGLPIFNSVNVVQDIDEEEYQSKVKVLEEEAKQAIFDFNQMTKDLPRKKKKQTRKSYQEFNQLW